MFLKCKNIYIIQINLLIDFFKRNTFFQRNTNIIIQLIWKHIKNPNSQRNFENKEIWGQKFCFQNLLPIYSNQNTLVFTWKQIHRPINRIESSEINPCLQSLPLFIYFIWRLITLQYHGGFWHTLTRISHGVHVSPSWPPPPPSSPSHPSGLSQCTGFECPVLCIKLGLVLYFTYSNTHVSMLFS